MQTVRSQLFEGITNEECARMFQCFGAREAGYEAGALISEPTDTSSVMRISFFALSSRTLKFSFLRPRISLIKSDAMLPGEEILIRFCFGSA